MEATIDKNLVIRINALAKQRDSLMTKRQMLQNQIVQLGERAKQQGLNPENLGADIQRMSANIKAFQDTALPILAEIEKSLSVSANADHVVSDFKGFE